MAAKVHAGFALIEWLLSAVLGMLLLAAALACLQASLRMAQVQRAPLQRLATAEWIMARLQRQAAVAGGGSVQAVLRLDATADELVFQRLLARDEITCDGIRAPAGTRLRERYYLRQEGHFQQKHAQHKPAVQHDHAAWRDPGQQSTALACMSVICDSVACVGAYGQGAALSSSIAGLAVRYGVAGGEGLAIEYLDAASFSRRVPTPPVLSLRVGLLINATEVAGAGFLPSLPTDWLGHGPLSRSGAAPESAWQMTLAVGGHD